MSSYKCVQCGLVNWTIEDFCKRCGVPNPTLAEPALANNFSSIPPPNHVQTQPVMPRQSIPDYTSPPPPNVFGNQTGTALTNGYSNYAQPGFENYPPMYGFKQESHSPEFDENLKKAEKQIRNAWVCGVVVCSITLLFALIISSLSASPTFIPVSPAAMLFSVMIYGGLTLGVYFKSRVCATLLCSLFVLDKIIMWAETGQMGGIILAFVLIYYFALGIQGTFAYHKLMEQ